LEIIILQWLSHVFRDKTQNQENTIIQAWGDDDDDFGDFTDAPSVSPTDDDDATSAIMPSSPFNTTLPNFHPTPLEYAYATFLLATYFSIPPNNDTKIQLLGSSAAPLLLTATNVPIPLIHACWNVVDPTGLGVLTQRNQFTILLRLIALAQAHLIPVTSGTCNPTEILLSTLERTRQLTVTLPTFDALKSGSVPSVARLLELYPPPPASIPVSQQLSSSSSSNLVVFGAGIEKTNSGEGIRTLSINDAFDSLIVDATTGSSSSPSGMQLHISAPTHVDLSSSINDIVDDDEFGDFEGAQAGEELAKDEEVAVNDDDDDDFGNFEVAQPSPPIVNNAIDERINNNNDDDDFGNVETPPSPLTNNVNNGFGKFDGNNTIRDPPLKFASSMNNGHVQTLSISDAFDELVGVDNDVATTLDHHLMSSPMNNEIELNGNDENNDDEFGDFEATDEGVLGSTPAYDNDFGNFEEPTHEASMSANNINDKMKTLSISDAFQSVSADEVVKRDHVMPSENIQINVAEDENNDDFGNFSTAADDDNEFGDFDTAIPGVIVGNGKSLSISDAFEGLLAEDIVTDLPLPPLSVEQDVVHDDVVDFGDFEAPAEIDDFGDFDAPTESSLPVDTISSHVKSLSISDAFEELIANDTPTAQCGSLIVNVVDDDDDNVDAFEEFNEAEIDLPLQPMNADTDENDDFGDFEAPTEVKELEGFDGPAQDALGHVKTLSVSDAFEGLIKEEVTIDQPLQSMNADTDENDDFGDFEAPTDVEEFEGFDGPAQDALGHVKTSSISDAFEGLIKEKVTIDQPLQPTNDDTDENDDFGDFEAPTDVEMFEGFDGPAQDALGHVKILSISDAFEGLINEEIDQPLQSMNADTDENDDFGDFEFEGPAHDTLSTQNVNVVDDDNIDAFKEFKMAEIDEPLQAMNSDNTDEIDDFGDFEAPPEVDELEGFDGPAHDNLSIENVNTHVKTLSISDAFEGLIDEEAAVDHPLQLINADAGENDVFGDFEAPAEIDDFGDFDGPIESSLPANAISGHVKIQSISDAFEELIANATSTAQCGSSSVNVVDDDDDDDDDDNVDAFEDLNEAEIDLPLQPMNADTDENDDFGDFEAPPEVDELEGFDGPAQNTLSNQNVNTHVKTQSKLDAFEGYIAEESEASPSAQFGSSSVDIVQDDEDIDIGVDDENDKFNTLDPPAQDKPVVNNHIKTLSISDAFEGLIHETAAIVPPLSNVEAGIDDDNFGDFETPAVDNTELVETKVMDYPPPPLVIPSTINLSHQRMVSEITTAGGTWKDMTAISDASAMMPVVSGNQNIDENNDMIDDDFGDFEGVEGDNSGADGGGIAGAGFTSPEHQVLSINENGDFGGFGVVEESSHVISVNDNDNEGFVDSAAISENESNLHLNSHVKIVSVSDAFDELLSKDVTLDYPLPPLMPTLIPTAEMTSSVDDMTDPDIGADSLEFKAGGHDSVVSSSYVDEFGDFSGKAGESVSGGDDNKDDQLIQDLENVDISTKASPVDIVEPKVSYFEEEKKTNFDDGNYHNNQSGELKGTEVTLSAILDGVHSTESRARFDENDHFGEFVDFPSQENDNKVTATTPIQNDDGDDSFGQFGDFLDSLAHNTTEEITTGHNTSTSAQDFINEEDDLFGDFGDANHDFSETEKDSDSVGQFDAFPTLTDEVGGGASDLFIASSTTVHNDDDFSTFDGSDTNHHSKGGFGHDDNSNDDPDSFGDFSSVANDTPQQQNSDKEFVLEEILGVEFGRLVCVWKDVILRAVECDLQKAIETIDELSHNLPSTDRACIIKSRKFQDYIFGLAEFVRVVRCISATIGDLLCVDKNIELQETNLLQWKDNSIIADAIVIEYLWSQLLSTSVALGMSPIPELESVVEIRARGSLNVAALNNKVSFCQLTLRPLEGGTGTQSRVVWNDKEYMACAANFCANRVPGQAFD
jgi:hypothetical protein